MYVYFSDQTSRTTSGRPAQGKGLEPVKGSKSKARRSRSISKFRQNKTTKGQKRSAADTGGTKASKRARTTAPDDQGDDRDHPQDHQGDHTQSMIDPQGGTTEFSGGIRTVYRTSDVLDGGGARIALSLQEPLIKLLAGRLQEAEDVKKEQKRPGASDDEIEFNSIIASYKPDDVLFGLHWRDFIISTCDELDEIVRATRNLAHRRALQRLFISASKSV